MTSSLATGIVGAETASKLEAIARLSLESLTLSHQSWGSTTHISCACSRSLRPSASFRLLLSPIPECNVVSRLPCQPRLLPYQPPSGYNVFSLLMRVYLEPGPEVTQPRLVDILIWTLRICLACL